MSIMSTQRSHCSINHKYMLTYAACYRQILKHSVMDWHKQILKMNVLRGPSQKKCTECNTCRIEHQMCGKVLQSFSVFPLLPNDCIPTFWKVHDTRQVPRTVELSDASGNGSRKVLQRRETHTTHVGFQFWEQVEVRGTHCGAVGWMG